MFADRAQEIAVAWQFADQLGTNPVVTRDERGDRYPSAVSGSPRYRLPKRMPWSTYW